MKKLTCSLLLFVLTVPLSAQYKTPQQIAKFYHQICRDYFPDGTEILNYYKDNPKKYTCYTSGTTAKGHLLNLSTVIHESQHGYENAACDEWYCTSINLGDGMIIPMPHGKVYDTRELDTILPKADVYMDSIFRYDPYIISEDGMVISAHTYGIYGLLEEMNAYYLGARVSFEIWPWFEKELGMKDYEGWMHGPLSGPGDDFLALHQFRLFIAWYIENARDRHPDVYESIMSDMNLRVAYTLLDKRFAEKEIEFRTKLDEYCARIAKAADVDFKVDERGFVYYHYTRAGGSGGYGSGTSWPETVYCKKLLNGTEWERILEEFKVKGVTESNYRSFIEI